MSTRHTSPRAIRKALELPPEALADLAERLVDKLDAAAPEPDLEPEPENARTADDAPLLGLGTGDDDDAEEDGQDRCAAADDDPRAYLAAGAILGAGDLVDAEDGGDREPDHDAEPVFPAYRYGMNVLGARCWTGDGL